MNSDSEIIGVVPHDDASRIDMEPILEKVPPIEGTFSPDKEVQQILLLPKAERKEAMISFKDKLARQREAWALCRTSIEEQIESNPDLSRGEMVGVISEFASSYGFPDTHVKVAESLVDDYIEMRKKVVGIREEFPDNIALINRLTGVKFTENDAGDFVITVGPMSIEISCSSSNMNKIYYRTRSRVSSAEIDGFATQSGDSSPINYIVINREVPPGGILEHEREHNKNALLEPRLYGTTEIKPAVRARLDKGIRGILRHQIGERIFRFERNFESELFERYEAAEDPEEEELLLSEFMRLERERALNLAKNEIVAQRSGHHLFDDKNREFFHYTYLFGGDFPEYDYLKKIREFDGKTDDPLWQKVSRRVLVDEYKIIIERARIASIRLRFSGKYSEKEVIAMLSDKRLQEWPKTVKRLLEQKKSKG